MPTEIKVIRSSRKTLSLEITKEAQVLVRAPYRLSQLEIERFVQEKAVWIEKHLKAVRNKLEDRQKHPVRLLGMEDIQRLADEAMSVLPAKATYYAPKVGVAFGRITIRNQRTRWGSCSSAGNLNFNCLLMLMPPEIIDYVVVHELCHRLEMNHSPYFWAEVERVLPDYRKRRKWLRDNGEKIMRRISSPL